MTKLSNILYMGIELLIPTYCISR